MKKIVIVFGFLALVAPGQALAAGQTSIFYYPWYGTPKVDGEYTHWDQGGHAPPVDIASNFYPARGPYSSADPAVVNAQMREIAKAGIREVVSSWWGTGSAEDLRLPMILAMARAQRLQVAIQIEPYDDRSAVSVEADIARLRTLGITRFYVYDPFQIDTSDWAALIGRQHGIQVFAQTANVARAQVGGFTGLYTYDVARYGPGTFGPLCERAHRAGLLCAPSVGPGYDAVRTTGDALSRDRRDGATYDALWQAAVDARADRITITSYNEWHEGTQIEAAMTPLSRSLAGTSASPVTASYESYDGAYGMHGRPASRAYLLRTAFWTALYRGAVTAARAPSIARTTVAGGRESALHAEGIPTMTSAPVRNCRPPDPLAPVPETAVRDRLRNLLLCSLPSRLMPAVRARNVDRVVGPPGLGVLEARTTVRGARCYPGRRPQALLELSAVPRCASSSWNSRSTCTKRTASRAARHWGKARR